MSKAIPWIWLVLAPTAVCAERVCCSCDDDKLPLFCEAREMVEPKGEKR